MRVWPFDRDRNVDRRISSQTGTGTSPRSTWWLPGFGAGLAAVLVVAVQPSDSTIWDFTFLVATLVSLVILLGAAIGMPRGVRTVWWSLLALQVLTMSAQALSDYQENAPDEATSFPGLIELLSLAAYLPVLIALGMMMRRLSLGRGRDALIDASILSVTAGLVFALFLAVPLLSSPIGDPTAASITLAYLVLDFVVLASLIWLLVGGGRPRPALLLVSLSLTFTLIANVARDIALAQQESLPSHQLLDALLIAALITMAAAATTPSAEAITTPPTQDTVHASTSRLIVLALGVLAVPSLVALRLWGMADQTTVLLSLGAVFIIILAVWRITLLVAALERQQHVTELVLDSAGDGIVGLDREGNVLFANLAARRMLGCREDDLIGRRFHDVAHHEYPDGRPFPWLECPVRELVMSGSEAYLPDHVYVRRDGTSFPVEIVLSPLFSEGTAVGAVQSFRDVSERTAVDELKRQLVSVVSHELRTPLTSIHGSLRMLDSGIVGSLNDDQRELLTMAVVNSDRLGRLVNDILDIERLDAGRMPLKPELTDALVLAEQAVVGIGGAAGAAGVRLSVEDLSEGASTAVWADPHRILQVLTNLLGNAIKFSSRQSTVRVTVEGSADTVRIAVIDTGRGIPEDQLVSVFDRFRQVDVGDARREGGTGLGLAIAKELVERSGGTLTVSSVLGVGSTFTTTLPAAAPADTEDATDRIAAEATRDVVAQEAP